MVFVAVMAIRELLDTVFFAFVVDKYICILLVKCAGQLKRGACRGNVRSPVKRHHGESQSAYTAKGQRQLHTDGRYRSVTRLNEPLWWLLHMVVIQSLINFVFYHNPTNTTIKRIPRSVGKSLEIIG